MNKILTYEQWKKRNKRRRVWGSLLSSIVLLGGGIGIGLAIGLKSCNSNPILSIATIKDHTNLKGKYLIFDKEPDLFPSLGDDFKREDNVFWYGKIDGKEKVEKGIGIYQDNNSGYGFLYGENLSRIELFGGLHKENTQNKFVWEDWWKNETYFLIPDDTSDWVMTKKSDFFTECLSKQIITDKEPTV